MNNAFNTITKKLGYNALIFLSSTAIMVILKTIKSCYFNYHKHDLIKDEKKILINESRPRHLRWDLISHMELCKCGKHMIEANPVIELIRRQKGK